MINLLLQEFVTIFAVSAAVVVLFNFLKQPPIAGFIITGIVVGPAGFGWIKDIESIQHLAEIGLIFLLFSIGIEFSIKSLASMRRGFFGAGTLQVGVTSAIVCAGLWALGVPASKSLLIGFLVSLSSTAIVLNLLHRRRELLSPQGHLSVAVLLFQDLFAVPLLLILPIFAAGAGSGGVLVDLLWTLLKAGSLLLTVFLGSRYFVPYILKYVAGTGVRELFLITIALLAFGSAWLGAEIGLSVVLGAFLAGMLVSETQYSHQVVADLVPLREPFVAIFFVSVGMLLDLTHFLHHWPIIICMAVVVILLKLVVAAGSAFLLRYELRIALLMGLMLSQIGEFSFVVAQGALQLGAITNFDYQHFLSISIVTMLINPSLILLAPQAITLLEKSGTFMRYLQIPLLPKKKSKAAGGGGRSNHVIIIGLGVIGQNLAKLLAKNEIPFIGIETDSRLFHRLFANNVSVIFGDGARAEILEAADIRNAQLVVVAINDANWTAHIVASIRQLRPDIRIIIRCQYFKDMGNLEKVEANEFVVAEAQMAVEFSERVLKHFGVDSDAINASIEETERENYRTLRQE